MQKITYTYSYIDQLLRSAQKSSYVKNPLDYQIFSEIEQNTTPSDAMKIFFVKLESLTLKKTNMVFITKIPVQNNKLSYYTGVLSDKYLFMMNTLDQLPCLEMEKKLKTFTQNKELSLVFLYSWGLDLSAAVSTKAISEPENTQAVLQSELALQLLTFNINVLAEKIMKLTTFASNDGLKNIKSLLSSLQGNLSLIYTRGKNEISVISDIMECHSFRIQSTSNSNTDVLMLIEHVLFDTNQRHLKNKNNKRADNTLEVVGSTKRHYTTTYRSISDDSEKENQQDDFTARSFST